MPRAAAKSCLLWLANSMLLLSIPVIFWFTMECIKSIPFRAGHDPSPLSPDILGNSNHMGNHPNRHQSGIRFRLIDQPNSSPHKIHQRPMPKVGGLAIILAIISINLLAGNFKSDIIRVILLASIIAFLFGLWDDTHRLSPRWKLVGQSDKLNMALTLIWTIGITNAFNFVDSMDGLAIGLAAIASASFMLVTADAGQPALSLLSAILLGSCIGMLYFNALPARTFLGDSGTQFLGFILAALGKVYTPPGLPQSSSWFVPILLLSVPSFDTSPVVSYFPPEAKKGCISSWVGSHISPSGKLGMALFLCRAYHAFIRGSWLF